MFLDPVFSFAFLAAKCHHAFSHLHTCHLLKVTLKVTHLFQVDVAGHNARSSV